MPRSVQGLCIVLGSLLATVGVLAAALAWGPHQCELVFPNIIGCAMASYEGLTGAMIAGGTALVAGWLAWSAVQVQIAAEERRAEADRKEVEQVLQDDVDRFAEALGAIWKILEGLERQDDQQEQKQTDETYKRKLSGGFYGIEEITKKSWLSSSRKMAELLGWKRRRDYEALFDGLEHLGQIGEANFNIYHALDVVRSVSIDFERLRPDTEKYFAGRFRRSGKAYTLGYAIEVQAGVAQLGRASFDPAD